MLFRSQGGHGGGGQTGRESHHPAALQRAGVAGAAVPLCAAALAGICAGGGGDNADRLLHTICHIEFNAINLALDAAYRFRLMPDEFVYDWIKVACEEEYHFRLMSGRLKASGYAYGDFDTHNHLWDMAYKTAFDPLLRMALVPRVLEARGLDVTPGIRAKARSCVSSV